jgi:hypothetical protein
MAKMERVAVWALMSNNMGGGKDVFTVRSRLTARQSTVLRGTS